MTFSTRSKSRTSQRGVILVARWRTPFLSKIFCSPTGQKIVWLGVQEVKPEHYIYSLHCLNYRTGQKLWSLKSRDEINDVTFSPDGKTLAYISGDFHLEKSVPLIRVLDISTGRLKHSIASISTYQIANGLKFSPDGKTIAYGSFNTKSNLSNTNDPFYDMAVVCLDAKTRKIQRALHGLKWGHITDIAFSPNGRYIAATTFAGDAGVAEYALWRKAGRLIRYQGEYNADGVSFLSNNRLVAGDTILIRKGHRFVPHKHINNLAELAFIEAANRHDMIAAGINDTDYPKIKLEVWRTRPRKKIFTLQSREYMDNHDVLPSHNAFVLGYGGELKIWRIREKLNHA